MRLLKSKVEAEEELITVVNKGYRVVDWIQEQYETARKQGLFDAEKDRDRYRVAIEKWEREMTKTLNSIFPTEWEANMVLNEPRPDSLTVRKANYDDTVFFFVQKELQVVRALERVLREQLPIYTDLPIKSRLYIEDIESFRKVRDVNPAAVSHLLSDGFLNRSEDVIQMALESILDVPLHKKDWGGEINDLYTANVIVNSSRTATAFLLKGNGLDRKVMEIRHCGKSGDQLVRLFRSPAELFVVQFVGEISESVISDIESKVNERRNRGESAHYCVMNGQDTARLLYAYKEL